MTTDDKLVFPICPEVSLDLHNDWRKFAAEAPEEVRDKMYAELVAIGRKYAALGAGAHIDAFASLLSGSFLASATQMSSPEKEEYLVGAPLAFAMTIKAHMDQREADERAMGPAGHG